MSSSKLKGTIIGMVLGDGCLTPIGNGRINSRLQTSSIHKEYVEWKKSILEELTAVSMQGPYLTNGHLGKNPVWQATTAQHPLYTELRMRMYHDGKRSLDEFVLKTLSPLGLLIWYLDDGSWDERRGHITIASNRYSYADHLLIAKVMNDHHGIRWNIHQKFKKKNAERFCSLYLPAKDRLRFFERIIEPFKEKIPSCFSYKVPSKERLEYLHEKSSKI